MDLEATLRQFASQVAGEFINGRGGGFFLPWDSDKVIWPVDPWTVRLDFRRGSGGPYGSPWEATRVRALYLTQDGFRFKIHHRRRSLTKLLGMQDIQVGYSDFDRAFVIKSNEEAKARQFFASRRLRQLIPSEPGFELQTRRVARKSFWSRKGFPEEVLGINELCLDQNGIVTNLQTLTLLSELFREALTQLCAVGSATRRGVVER